MRTINLLGLVCVLFSAPVAAQSLNAPDDSDVTLIYGTVSPVCTVETDTPVAVVQLNSGTQDVSNVTYTCNNLNGFTRRISSENGGSLVRENQSIPYLLSQTGASELAFAPVSLQTLQTDSVASFSELAIGSTGVLRVQVPTIPSGLFAGDYVDTVTIEITPN